MKTLLITGASSGIGLATARVFASHGYRVFDLSRSGASSDKIIHIKCDVCCEDDITNAILSIRNKYNVTKIDVLICNAGFGISGPIEFTPIESAQKQLDVNFFGAVRMIQAVLPIMRLQHEGHIILTSSIAGVLPIPYQAFYSASKAAINALGLSLRNELREFGINVSVVMPGDVKSGFTASRTKNVQGEDIYLHARHAIAIMENDEQNGMSPERIARHFYQVAQHKHPLTFSTIGIEYKCFLFLHRIFPTFISNWIVHLLYH